MREQPCTRRGGSAAKGGECREEEAGEGAARQRGERGEHRCCGGAGNTCRGRTGRCMRCRGRGAHGSFGTSEQLLLGCEKLGVTGTLPARGAGGIWDASSAV